MKKLLIIIGIILFIPLCVNAETITYNICKTGCEYSDLNTVIESINRISEHSDVVVNIQDNDDYVIEPQICSALLGENYLYNESTCVVIGNKYIDSFKISGHNQKISVNTGSDENNDYNVNMYPFNYFEVSNIQLNWDMYLGDNKATDYSIDDEDKYYFGKNKSYSITERTIVLDGLNNIKIPSGRDQSFDKYNLIISNSSIEDSYWYGMGKNSNLELNNVELGFFAIYGFSNNKANTKVTFNNVRIAEQSDYLYLNPNDFKLDLNINNSNLKVYSPGMYNDANMININNSEIGAVDNHTVFLKGDININNSIIEPSVQLYGNTFEIKNSTLDELGLAQFTDGSIHNSNIENITLSAYDDQAPDLNIYDSKVNGFNNYSPGIMNLYNCTLFDGSYVKVVASGDDIFNPDFGSQYEQFHYRDYNINNEQYGISFNTNSYIYFDKNINIKVNEKKDLTELLPYYDNGKEVNYNILDETIAKVKNKQLIGMKPGKTNLTITTDDGHIIYRINLTVEPLSSGVVEKKEPQIKNYAQADFSSSDLNSVIPLTNEEQSLKDSGKNVEVFLEVKDVSKTVAKEEKKLIEEKLDNNEEIGTYLDVSLFKQVEGEEASKIEKTNENISVSLTVPENLINKDNKIKRTYYILRLHEGAVDKLETNFDGKVLTFETDRFSTYALTYKDEVISNVNNPKTGDGIIKYLILMIGCIMTTIILSNKNIERRNR